jgi:hypothetical protein
MERTKLTLKDGLDIEIFFIFPNITTLTLKKVIKVWQE